MRDLAPVFVMNPYYSGLGIARSLACAGVPVYALTCDRNTPGARSRYFAGIYEVPDGRDQPERLRDRILQIRRQHEQRPVLFPTRDFDLLFLHEHRNALGAAYRLPQPEGASLVRTMDKYELAQVAASVGIPTPATAVVGSMDELERLMPGLRFPLVIKPRFAEHWRRNGLWQRVGASKAIIVGTPEELRSRYCALSALTPELLVQTYVSGLDADIAVCCCYISQGGELLGHFTGRKLKQNPPLVGTGSVVEATEVDEVLALSLRLLRALGHRGLAEVEFKYDSATRTFFLIEVNPRHWDQHELGTLVGVNLSLIAYQDMTDASVRSVQPAYRTGQQYKWVAERELLLGIADSLSHERRRQSGLSALRAVGTVLREAAALLRGERVFALMRLRDPMPSLLMCLRLLADGWNFLGRRSSRLVLHKQP